MPRKENTKAKTWERDRRNRMNSYFKNLSDLLPPLLEGRKRNKIDILVHASKYIKELHSRTDELFCDKASDAHKEELARLKKLVTQLLSRTQLLTDLLKNAGINVPAEPALEKISPLKWSNRINVVSGCKIVDIAETDKAVEKKKKKSTNDVKKKNSSENVTEQSAVQNEKSNCTIEDQENCVGSEANKSSENAGKSSLSNDKLVSSGSVSVVQSKPEIKDHKKVKRKKRVVRKKPVIKKSSDINSLPTGTLVFSGGKIMPVVTPMQSLTSNIIVNTQPRSANPIILNNGQQGQMIVVQPIQANHFQTISTMQTLNTVPNIQANVLINPQDWAKNVKTVISSSKVGGMKAILPKTREVTETTMTYKVPIPAIHKEKIENKCESKDKFSSEKQTKTKTNCKNVVDSKSENTEVQNKVLKRDNKDGNMTKKKVNIDKQGVKRAASSTFATESEAKKKKRELKENADGNLQVNKNVLDNNVTCESIENLKQVIEKIGEETPYADVQLSDSTNCSSSTPSEQKNDNNLVNKSNSLSANEKPEEKSTECSADQRLLNSDVSNGEKETIEKEMPSESSLSQSKDNILEKIQNVVENSDKNDSTVLTESTTVAENNKVDLPKENTISLSPSGCSIDENIILPNETNQSCNIDNRLNNIIQSNNQNDANQEQVLPESNKILLNLDTNTTMKLDGLGSKIDSVPTTSPSIVTEEESIKLKDTTKEDQSIMKAITYSPSNSFVPINKPDSLHSDLSNDIFASLQVPSSSNNSESISPTAAFLMAFPIVSSLGGKADVLDDDLKDDFKYSSQTPPMLLQIGAIEPNNFKINTRPLLNDNLETVEPSAITQQSPVKSSTDPTPPTTNSAPVTTCGKTLPRVISSHTITDSFKNITDSFKIIPVSSEQINKQLTSNEASNSLSTQTNSVNQAVNSNSVSTSSLVSTNSLVSTSSLVSTNSLVSTSSLVSASKNQSQMVVGNTNKPVNTSQSYPANSKSQQSNFNYTKDMPLSSIASSMATDILNKYISTTSLSTNSMATTTSTKYNPVVNYVSQNCQSSMPVCSKENLDRSNQYNFSTNDIPTEKDLCKLPLCPIEAFTERSNEYSARNKQHSFSNPPVQVSNSEVVIKNTQPSMNQEKIAKPPIQSNQNMTLNANYHPTTKKVENKVPFSNAEQNVINHKKESQVPNLNSYNITTCDNKINKKMIPTTSQASNPAQKLVPSSRSNTFPQQPNVYVSTTGYQDTNITRTTTTVATTSSNFSILSWTTFSSPSSSSINNNNFPQYESTPAPNEIPKTTCDNFNYLPLKDNVSLPNTMPQPSYFTVDTQAPSYDKSKSKMPVDTQKRSYDMNKSRNMRVSQTASMQKSPRSHVPPPISTSDYKYHAESKKQYKYPMDVDYSQHNYTSGLDLPPHMQQQQQHHHQSQQQTHQPPNHQSSSKALSSQQISSHKSDKPNYMLPDYDSHANFNTDSSNLQPRYANNHDGYSSANFKYNEKNQQVHSKYQPTSQVPPTPMHHDNSMYSNNNKHMQHQPQSSQSKSKADQNSQVQPVQQQQQQQPQQQQQQMNQQHASRPPVNWMMTPEIKHNSNITDIILPPIGKELDFCQNNLFSQSATYNQSGSNHQFYNNYDMSTHTFPNIAVLPGESKRNVDTTYYPEEQTFSWSPTKNLSQNTEQNQNQNLKGIETPTLPALVGDLALSSNISDKQNFLFGQMPVRSNANELNKDTMKDKESTSRDYQNVVNSQNAQQHSSHGMPFLSVSQLVDHEKAEKNQQSHNTANHHQHHPHHPPPQQQSPQQPPARKQRKGSNSPRASNKRQMDMRHKQSTNSNNDQIHRQHEEPKTSSSNTGFNESNYQQAQQQPQQQSQQPQQQQPQQQQQQKYNQTNNEVQWRSRNCKSNYTAEALIGSNTNQTDNSHSEKNLPKYSANYSQNKFSGTLTSDPMPINYFSNVEDASSGYGQVMNQNFNPSYAYSSNANIYPSTNFITNITNSSTNYMMPLHENSDYLDSNNFLLPPNVSTTSITTPLLTTNMTDGSKSHQHYTSSKHQNCDKRPFYGQQKKSKRKSDNNAQNFPDFPITSPLDDYHHTSTPFLTNPLYQSQPSVYPKPPLPPASSSSSSNVNQAMTQQHHPSGTSLTNFNLSTIFPEINDKVTGYKSSTITQPTSHTLTSYSQRSNYSDPMGQMPQASETTTHFNNASGSR